MRRPQSFIAFILCCFLAFLLSPETFAAKKTKKKPYAFTARSAILSDSTKVKRLYGKNVNLKVAPASTTKVMTALLVLEKLPLDKVVTVSRHATSVAPSKAGLAVGERYKVSELLYASLMQSANDASVALAEAVAGSESAFVTMMNKRAKQLGATRTKFVNPHGLPTKTSQYTTAYDIYLIFREALKHHFFKKALQYKKKMIVSESGRTIHLRSFNKLLSKGWKTTVYGKTGYTKKAKYCFVGYLTNGNSTLIVAVFGCTKRWQDIQHLLTKYGKIKLF